ncbi:MAG TPA: hypothetical protein VFA99_10400 [Acidobacteriaceae bacterium]|nr:hypothetical protein [Acidobacteriaceae bacterium]
MYWLLPMGMKYQSWSLAVSAEETVRLAPGVWLCAALPRNPLWEACGLYAELLQNRTFRASWEGVALGPGTAWRLASGDRGRQGHWAEQGAAVQHKAYGQCGNTERTGWIDKRWVLGSCAETARDVSRLVLCAKADDASVGPVFGDRGLKRPCAPFEAGERFERRAAADDLSRRAEGSSHGANEHPAAATYEATNSINDPDFIHPVESTVKLSMDPCKHSAPGLTIEVIDIPLD